MTSEPPHRSETFAVFRAAFDALPFAVLVAGEDGTIVFGNPPACTLFAYSPAELVGLALSTVLPDWSADRHAEILTEFSDHPEGLQPASLALPGLRKDGVLVPIEASPSVLVEGDIRHLVVSIADVTERLNLEARLAAATHEHLGFQRLVVDIAARFSNVDPEALPETISDSLRQLGEALQLDRVALWHWRAGEATVTVADTWERRPQAHSETVFVATMPYVTSRIQNNQACWFTTWDDIPDPIDRQTFRRSGTRSIAVVPLARYEAVSGNRSSLTFSSMSLEVEWAPAIVERLRLVAAVMSQALAGAQGHESLKKALDEVRQLRDRAERAPVRRDTRVLHLSNIVVAESPSMKNVLAQIAQVTPTPATVLLLGETGTGKEVMAQAIHDLSPRHQRQMVRVSCAAIPTALIESELFGRERGAYTGALSRQIGRFEAANQSTLFLDEIGELPAEVQVKLLRVLQERVIERLGSTQSVKVDVRIIAATNRDLEKAVDDKTFREDLFYRLNVFPIVVPPLRERIEDIPGLVWAFIDEFSRNFGKTITSISKESMQDLQRYQWPGNVRELRNVIERAVIISTAPELAVSAPRPPTRMPQAAMTLTALEIEHIRAVLESTNWRVRGSGGAAQRLGLKPTTLESRMAKLGIMRKKAT